MSSATMANRMRALTRQVIERHGEVVTVTRTGTDGSTTTFTAKCRPQPLTPTFVHRIHNEAGENIEENDQRDFVFAGDDTDAFRDLDTITWDGYTWKVSTTSEQRLSGVIITIHCLSVKLGVVANGL